MQRFVLRFLALGICLFAASLASSRVSEADRGVGVSLSRIDVADVLRPGGSYSLPSLGVLNTGDEPGDYEVRIGYVEGQSQQRPDQGWLDFQPRRFFLQPGESRSVEIRIELPSGADPGDYFAFIEARPVSETSNVSIGVAAATRLSFTVDSSSWFAAQRLRISRFLRDTEPWSYVVEGLIVAGLLVYFVGRYSPVKPSLRFERRR